MSFLPSLVNSLYGDAHAGASAGLMEPDVRQQMPMRALMVGSLDARHQPVEETLRSRGHEVVHGENADEAWAAYTRVQPHLVLLTRIDEESLALCRRMRATEHGESVILVALVRPEADGHLQGMIEAEVDDCVAEGAGQAYLEACLKLAERRSHRRVRRRQMEAELAARVRQQAAVAELGQRVLAGVPAQEVMDYAVEAVARALDAPFCKVLVRAPGRDALLLQAGVGWKEGLVGRATVGAGKDSQAGYTLHSEEPVVVEDLRAETRFSGPPLLREHGVVSGISVMLQVDGEPYGVLGAHTDQHRLFHQDDVTFLQAVANVLSSAAEREQAEDELLQQRNFVSAVLDTAGALVVVLDAEGRIVRFNRACERTTGYTFEEVEGRRVWDLLLVPEEVEGVKKVFGELRDGTARNDYENIWLTKEGAPRRIAWSNTVLLDGGGRPEYVIGTGIDVTGRKRAEEALRESEARTRAILETTVDGIITIDERGRIETFNLAAEKIFGYRAEDVVGQNVHVLMPPPYHEEHDGYIQNYLETGHRKIIGIGREVTGRRKDGTVFPLDLAVSEMRLGDRRIFTGIVRDITDRVRLEQEILRISEQERRRIGQDLHDGLGQMLTGIGLITRNLGRTLEASNEPAADRIAEITELLKEADQQARGLARGLMPVDLEAAGLASALQRLAVNAERLFGVRCTFEEVGSVLIEDNSVATHLYRIAQEAVSNAVKHGRARHVRLSLAAGPGRLRLRIQDDGVGFPEELDEDTRGMGVRIMQYRARLIGATLEIAGGLDSGTTITCTLRRDNTPLSYPEGRAA